MISSDALEAQSPVQSSMKPRKELAVRKRFNTWPCRDIISSRVRKSLERPAGRPKCFDKYVRANSTGTCDGHGKLHVSTLCPDPHHSGTFKTFSAYSSRAARLRCRTRVAA